VESLQHNDHPGEGGACRPFYGRPPGGVALPYASTTIVGSGGGGLATISTPAAGGCIPNPQAYMIQPNPASASDNFVRTDVNSAALERWNDSTGFQGTYCHWLILTV